MTDRQRSRRVLDRLRMPPVKWADVFDAIRASEETTTEFVGDLEAMAERATRMAAYFRRRAIGGDHAAAVRKSNAAGTAVRRGLGFSYPKQDINF